MAKKINLGKVGITTAGAYDPNKVYERLSCVTYNYESWVSTKDVPAGNTPQDGSEYWQKMSARGAQGIQGERGPQGNSSFDGNGVEIVNNLTQGGEAAVLSAEQGKILKNEVTELSGEIAEKRYTEGGILNYDTKFVARDGYSYTDFIKVEPTKNYIINFGEITSTAYIIEYDASHNKVDHWALLVGTTSYNLTMNAATEFIRFSFMTDNVDDAYVTYGNDVIWKAYANRITDLENIAKAHTAQLDELKNTSSQILLQDSTKLLSDNIRNCIKAVWISCQTKGNVEKLLEQLHTLYIAEITNKPGNYSPYVSLSQRVDSDDSSFVWYLTAQTEPRHGVEVISARISTTLFNSLGLNGFYPYINIEIDWDAFGQNVSVMNTGIGLSLKDIYRYHAERVSLTDCGSSIVNQSLVGKTIVFFGDSITEMTDNENSLRYSDYMAYFSGAKAINVGIGGTQLRQRTTPALAPSSSNQAYAALDIINVIKASCDRDFSMQIAASAYLNDAVAQVETLQGIDWTKVDGVVIFAGTNDWGVQNALGESGSADVNKTLGAVNEIIRLLLSTYPHLTLYWFTPIIRWVDYSNGVGDANKWSDIMDVEGNGTLKAMSHAIAEEVTLHHIPICDMYNTLGWNKYNFGRYFLPTDGTHPKTTEGTMYIAKKMLSFILANNTL